MKKSLFIVMAICAFFASCSHDSDPNVGDVVDVPFFLDVEAVLETRADEKKISDGTDANQLMYAVFREGDTDPVIKKVVKDDVEGLTKGYKMSISLAKGHSYQVVFWAQNSECDAYTVSDDMKVSIDYEGLNNDESRDAFFAATKPFVAGMTPSVKVVLRRPFAQVNVGTFPYDLEYVQGLDVLVDKSSAIFHSIADEIDLLTGEVSGEVDVEYKLSNIPEEILWVDVDENGVKEKYDWLSMSYILAEPDRTLKTMSFKFTDNSGLYEPIDIGELNNVPIQRNYRTNILGQILTGTTSFEIIVDPVYEGDEIYQDELYYNFSEDTLIKDKEFTFNNPNLWVTFTTENNNRLTLENVTFSGKMNQVAIGEYRGKTRNDVPYTNVLKNVKAENIEIGNGINNVFDAMSILFYLRGKTTLDDCVMTGAYNDNVDDVLVPAPANGILRTPVAYDCGVPNFCEAEFNNCTIGSLYAWSQSAITIKNSKVNRITCGTHDEDSPSHLTIEAGTTVKEIVVTSQNPAGSSGGKWVERLRAPKLIIKSGATVDVLDMNGRGRIGATTGVETLIIEEGANVKKIINEAK